ncbi:MAG: hypothetical protein ACSNEK_01900 [Parachlamydiaceae bacterium]
MTIDSLTGFFSRERKKPKSVVTDELVVVETSKCKRGRAARIEWLEGKKEVFEEAFRSLAAYKQAVGKRKVTLSLKFHEELFNLLISYARALINKEDPGGRDDQKVDERGVDRKDCEKGARLLGLALLGQLSLLNRQTSNVRWEDYASIEKMIEAHFHDSSYDSIKDLVVTYELLKQADTLGLYKTFGWNLVELKKVSGQIPNHQAFQFAGIEWNSRMKRFHLTISELRVENLTVNHWSSDSDEEDESD